MKYIFSILLIVSTNLLASDKGLNVVIAHPIFEESYTCNEHWDGQFKYLGDALGSDCVVQKLIETLVKKNGTGLLEKISNIEKLVLISLKEQV